jgi:uncharacterized protein (TIGR03086 family)
MTEAVDLTPAARRMGGLLAGVPEAALGGPTPCDGFTVGDLVDHIGGFALAFTAAALKAPIERRPGGDAARLAPDWRDRIPRDLLGLAEAWSEPEAWTGFTAAGGLELPGDVAGVVALHELLIHGCDLARATGQPGSYDGPGLEAVYGLVQHFRAAGVDGLYGPEVPVPDEAPLLDRVLALAGREPGWRPPV